MQTIRNGVFETNSSSTHSLTMCTENEYKSWLDGKLCFHMDGDRFVSLERAAEIDKELYIHQKAEYKDGALYYKGVAYTYQKVGDDGSHEYLDENGKTMYTPENLAEITKEMIEEWLEDGDADDYERALSYKEYQDWIDNSERYETFKQEYVLPSSTKVIAFGYYGNDY